MLNKLMIRNARRSMKDYLVYLITMGGVAALMFAFDSLVFSKLIQRMAETTTIMVAMIGIATFFIVLIVAWLINYMVRFMLEKRSREFGTYLLMGMEKRQVSKLYMRENLLLGIASLGMGLVAGVVLKQIVLSVFYQLFSQDYHIQIGTSPWCLVATVGCYLLCYLFALHRNRKIFRKMSIADFIAMEQSSEMVETGHERWKQLLFFFSILYFGVFFLLLFQGGYTVTGVIVAVILFIPFVYLFYQGLTAFLVQYIHKGGRKVYQRDGLFLLRQLSSKMRTMQFTMGTLTILFTAALLCGSVAMMFAGYQKEAIHSAIPFDVMVYGEDVNEDFATELALLKKEVVKTDSEHIYHIYEYENHHEFNDYLYMHNSNLGNDFVREDGSLDEKAVADSWNVYRDYDTYMALSDYNVLRTMLGYEKVELRDNEYLLHIKSRLLRDIEPEMLQRNIEIADRSLQFAGTKSEKFSLNGMNGSDYVLVVPDKAVHQMTPYYTVLALNTKGETPVGFQQKLEEEYYHSRGLLTEDEVYEKSEELSDQGASKKEIHAMEEQAVCLIGASGSDQILSIGTYDVMVKRDIEEQMLSIISSVTFPLVYISLIFICVAFTILAVQQLSDSTKYRYRYDVLRKLGVNESELSRLIFKQLGLYYLIPIMVSLILAGIIGIYAGDRFVFYTGAQSNALYYYGSTVLVFGGVYLLYFAATYLGFKRNVEEVFVRME